MPVGQVAAGHMDPSWPPVLVFGVVVVVSAAAVSVVMMLKRLRAETRGRGRR